MINTTMNIKYLKKFRKRFKYRFINNTIVELYDKKTKKTYNNAGIHFATVSMIKEVLGITVFMKYCNRKIHLDKVIRYKNLTKNNK